MVVSPSQIRALLALQARTTVHIFEDHTRRKGTILSVLLATVWYGLWLSAAAACAAAPNWVEREQLEAALSGLLLFVLAYWQLSPLFTMSLGASLDMRRLTLYPVTTPTLFVVECLLRLWTGLEMFLLLAGLLIGLLRAGSEQPWILALSFALFAAFNVFLSAGVRNLIERIFEKRMLREIILVLMISMTVAPQMLFLSKHTRGWVIAAVLSETQTPYWLFPSGLAARVGLGEAGPGSLLLLCGITAAAGIFGYWMFRSGCRFVSQRAGQAGPRPRRGYAGLRVWPKRRPALLPDPLAALVAKELKYLWRSPRFRLPFFMGFTFGVIAWAPIMSRIDGSVGDWARDASLSFITFYAMLLLGPVLFLNRFGFDRSAARLLFWMPIRFEDMLGAKNVATAMFVYLELLLIALFAGIVGLPVGVGKLAEAAVVTAVALLYLLSVGNYTSVRFPIPSNPDRVSRSGGSHGLRSAVQFFIFPLALAPIGFAFLLKFDAESTFGFWIALAVAAMFGMLIYRSSFLNVSARGLLQRETLLARLSESEGPLASE